MDIETYRFGLMTAILGMGIVFLFLGVLSLLMVVIMHLSDGQPHRSRTEDRQPSQPPDGVIAAAVGAFLLEEDRGTTPSADGWRPKERAYPAWMGRA